MAADEPADGVVVHDLQKLLDASGGSTELQAFLESYRKLLQSRPAFDVQQRSNIQRRFLAEVGGVAKADEVAAASGGCYSLHALLTSAPLLRPTRTPLPLW